MRRRERAAQARVEERGRHHARGAEDRRAVRREERAPRRGHGAAPRHRRPPDHVRARHRDLLRVEGQVRGHGARRRRGRRGRSREAEEERAHSVRARRAARRDRAPSLRRDVRSARARGEAGSEGARARHHRQGRRMERRARRGRASARPRARRLRVSPLRPRGAGGHRARRARRVLRLHDGLAQAAEVGRRSPEARDTEGAAQPGRGARSQGREARDARPRRADGDRDPEVALRAPSGLVVRVSRERSRSRERATGDARVARRRARVLGVARRANPDGDRRGAHDDGALRLRPARVPRLRPRSVRLRRDRRLDQERTREQVDRRHDRLPRRSRRTASRTSPFSAAIARSTAGCSTTTHRISCRRSPRETT